MFKIFPGARTLRTLAVILVLLVLLPAIFYSAYEISSLTQSENLVDRMYRQQLDAALFSVNQYAWDIANKWAGEINRLVRDTPPNRSFNSQDGFGKFAALNKGIHAIFATDTSAASTLLSLSVIDSLRTSTLRGSDFLSLVRSEHELTTRLLTLAGTGYRKIEGASVADNEGRKSTCLLFVISTPQGRKLFVGIVLDAATFVREALRPKLDEIAAGEFILSVVRKTDNTQIYATGRVIPGEERQIKDLWLFPDFSLGIRLQGQTIEELVRERFYRNLALLAVLDVMIIAGVWFVYRTVRREVELSQLKADFVSNVSHELRTPLSLIRMFGETLEMGRVPNEKKKQEYYSTIVRETERLTGLVNNILNFSRMESGKKNYELADVDLNSVVHRVLASYQAQLDHLGFALQTRIDAAIPAIRADAEAVAEALLNIVDNAVKYSREQKSITITTGKLEKSVFVQVDDKGIGIPHHEQSKIFEKFYRVSSGMVHETRGSGLGLTLVRHIMEAHKGDITVQSQPGQGSSFRLSFPINEEQAQPK